jgi:hypothetical protein
MSGRVRCSSRPKVRLTSHALSCVVCVQYRQHSTRLPLCVTQKPFLAASTVPSMNAEAPSRTLQKKQYEKARIPTYQLLIQGVLYATSRLSGSPRIRSSYLDTVQIAASSTAVETRPPVLITHYIDSLHISLLRYTGPLSKCSNL